MDYERFSASIIPLKEDIITSFCLPFFNKIHNSVKALPVNFYSILSYFTIAFGIKRSAALIGLHINYKLLDLNQFLFYLLVQIHT